MTRYWFEHVYLSDGWAADVAIEVDDHGVITQVRQGVAPGAAEVVTGLAMPGFANVHSHAFQRAMAGLSEVATSANDSFWTWRKLMYQFAQALSPEDLQAIASQLYMEMLMAGYTSVAEFHYLHHQAEGRHFEPQTAMSLAVVEAAEQTGIGLSLLPVLYMAAGFGGQALQPQQQRFGHSLKSYQALLQQLQQVFKDDNNKRLGTALHSLRAVPASAIDEALSLVDSLDSTAPVHIHIAEQQQEVHECLQHTGKRPVQWLLENQNVDKRWCLIHATHINSAEIQGIVQAGAVVGLCPTTEANLGDGIFPMVDFLQQGGRFAIGSDSNTSVSPMEELRWLEYGQRLLHRQRNVISDTALPHTAARLIKSCHQGGAQALARPCGELAVGKMADIIVLDDQQVNLSDKPKQHRLDAFVFSGNNNLVKDVIVAGRRLIENGRHPLQETIIKNYKQVLKKLQALL